MILDLRRGPAENRQAEFSVSVVRRGRKSSGGEAMLYLKACQRCKGDMHSNRDMYGPYQECLQCGHMVYLEQPRRMLGVRKLGGTRQKVA